MVKYDKEKIINSSTRDSDPKGLTESSYGSLSIWDFIHENIEYHEFLQNIGNYKPQLSRIAVALYLLYGKALKLHL